jgi:hypothetical protein
LFSRYFFTTAYREKFIYWETGFLQFHWLFGFVCFATGRILFHVKKLADASF